MKRIFDWTRGLGPLRALLFGLAFAALAGCGETSSVDPSGNANSPDAPRSLTYLTGPDILADANASLRRGHAETQSKLRQQGAKFADALDEIGRIDGIQRFDVESEVLIDELYRRAEVVEVGQGERVMARLYQDQLASRPALAESPEFEPFRKIIAETPPERLMPDSFRFGTAVSIDDIEIPARLRPAITELAKVYSGNNLSSLRPILQRAFGADALDVSRIVARSSTTDDVLKTLVLEHNPPPSEAKVLQDIMAETRRNAPAASQSADFLDALANLSDADRGFASQDGVQRRLASVQDELPSRRAQLQQARRVSMPGSIEQSGSRAARAFIESIGADINVARSSAGITPTLSAQNYSNYVAVSFDGFDNLPASEMASGGGGGGGGGGGAKAAAPAPDRSYSASRPSGSYAAQTAGARKVSTSYARAIRSARAARGIAAGAALTVPQHAQPINAAWVSNPEDDRFGRFVVQIQDRDDGSYLVASRTLFADSALAALDVLWGGHEGTTEFRDGHLLVLMSMDPFAPGDPALQARLERRAEELESRVYAGSIGEAELMTEMMDLQLQSAQMPRRVVVHPSLYGRELAWTTARVDFWFNDLEMVSRESAAVNGGTPMPDRFFDIDISQAQTWQFYERNKEILIEKPESGIGLLKSVSTGANSGQSERSHYAVSMFEFESDDANAEGRSLTQLATEIQPMLDWLSTNHHDFMRLSDFSEAFAISRWVFSSGIDPIVYDLDGEPMLIATPDRVIIGDGPKTK